MRTVSPDVARRIALSAQGFADPRPESTPTRRHLTKVLRRTGLLQLDSVNVAVRAHYMPLFARLGPYPTRLVDDAAWHPTTTKPRLLTEAWAHEASLVPVQDWPLQGLRRRWLSAKYAARIRAFETDFPGVCDDVLAVVKEQGPVGAGTIEEVLGRKRKRPSGGWWDRSEVKRACEWLFLQGELMTGTRRNFQRLYDLPERVVPVHLRNTEIDDDAAARELTRRAARSHGIATERDLRDYYRLTPQHSKQAVDELVEAGELEPVTVRGWRDTAYVHPDARTPRRVEGQALLCPFDPLIWERDRTQRIFGFHYRIEIYVPEPKRVYGYYVFPFLLDGRLVGRVDLKTDRARGVLRVQGAFAEDHADRRRVAHELAAELRTMAAWLELDGVEVNGNGDLAAELAAAVSPTPRLGASPFGERGHLA